MRFLKSKHLSDKILGYTMTIYLVVVFAITTWLVAETYWSARDGIYRELKLYENSFSIPLAENLWSMDMEKLASLVQAIEQIPEIIGARVIDPNSGTMLHQKGWVIDFEDGLAKYYAADGLRAAAPVNKDADEMFMHSFPLFHNPEGENQLIGKVTFFSETNLIFERIKYRVALMVAGSVFQILLLWFFFSWISRRFISRPLTQLTQSVEAFDLEKPEDPAQTILIKGEDELSILSRAFSAMQKRLVGSVRSLQQSQRELRHLNENLEEIVLERTAELKKLSEAVEQSPASVVITDKNGSIEYVNPTFSEISGYSAQEAIGQSPSVLKSGRLSESFYKDLWRTINAGRTWKGDFINRKKSGEEFWESASISPINNENGEITHFVAVKQDITERKEMEVELIHAKQTADNANKAKSDFLANMSHEIRTPMNAVIGMAYLALKTELAPKQRDYINKIKSSANALLGIINDILDFSKIEAGKLDMEAVEFNLDDALENLANLVTVKAREKDELEVMFATAPNVPRFLVGDPLRLGQVLINLANNAVKFTEAGEIVVATELLEKTGDRVELKFTIRDSGIGLTEDQMANLFQSFSQADTSTTRKFGGTGLGLAISKKLVNMMDGEIWVESEYGQGSSFIFTAAFGLGKETVKKRFAPSTELQGMKVLVVDDSATSREILREMLESFSFEVSLAASGEECLAEIEKADADKAFQLVIMDLKMPEMDGIEASERIKNHTGLRSIPAIILVTNYGREEVMQQAEKVGLDGFLLKPVNASILFDAIMQAFGKEVSAPAGIRRGNGKQPDVLSHIQGARVLLVEDNEINQQVAREILEGAGLIVSLANDGQEAVNAIKASRYDAVLMDIQMPVMDGHTATRKIRDWELEIRAQGVGERKKKTGGRNQFAYLPIIAMTAHAMAGDEEKSLKAGMDDHVTKPIEPDQLFAKLGKWIGTGEKRVQEQVSGDSVEISQPQPVVADEMALPKTLPGFDLVQGLNRLQGNHRLYRKLLQDFGGKYGETAAEIRKALDAKDFNQARSLLHNIKGLAGNLSATNLQAAAMEMEALVSGKSEKVPSDKALLQKYAPLEDALYQALEAVRTLGVPVEKKRFASNESEMASGSLERIKKTSIALAEAVEMGDVTQILTIAAKLKSESDALAPFCDQLVQLAEDFDFNGIQKLMLELGV